MHVTGLLSRARFGVLSNQRENFICLLASLFGLRLLETREYESSSAWLGVFETLTGMPHSLRSLEAFQKLTKP